jgi:glucose/arabinose dehydrogenase
VVAALVLSACNDGSVPVGPRLPANPATIGRNPADPPATISLFASGLDNPRGLTFGPDGFLHVAEGGTGGNTSTPFTGRIRRIDPSGNATTIADGLFLPSGMTIRPDGNLYVSNVGFGPLFLVAGQGEILKVRIN